MCQKQVFKWNKKLQNRTKEIKLSFLHVCNQWVLIVFASTDDKKNNNDFLHTEIA